MANATITRIRAELEHVESLLNRPQTSEASRRALAEARNVLRDRLAGLTRDRGRSADTGNR